MYNNLNYTQILVLATVISVEIGKNKSSDELYFLGNLLIAIGSNLYVIASTKVLNEPSIVPPQEE